MQGGLSQERIVCPFVRPSVKCVNCDKTKETCVDILEQSFILVFWQEEWLVGVDPFCLKFWVKLTRLEQKCRFYVGIRS